MMSEILYNMYVDYTGMHVVSHVMSALWWLSEYVPLNLSLKLSCFD